MGDDELGTFSGFDWAILIFFAAILPIIAFELAR